MEATFVQEVIQIGDELGVIIPPEEVERLGLKVGDEVLVRFELVEK